MADNVAMFPGAPPPNMLPIIPAGAWKDKPVPDRMWLLEGWIPLRRATLLTGDGGSGKSLLAQQLATCAALGEPFMGMPVRQSDTLYITCEDDTAELHRRQAAICRSLGTSMERLGRSLFMLSRCGELDNSLLHFGTDGVALSQFYRSIEDTIKAGTISFLILDNIAHLFEGNENVRQHVAIFCNALERLCIEVGTLTILFIGHPSKAGAQFSGSTAWENQIRSRIYLERPKDDSGSYDDDVRLLSRAKSNYAKSGDSLTMRWQDWAFAHYEDSERWSEGVRITAQGGRENDIFLACLAKATEQRRALSHSPHAGNYAPKVMAQMPTAKGANLQALKAAMERLFHLEAITADQPLWLGQDRKHVRGIALAGRLRDGSQSPLIEPIQAIENISGMVPEPECGTVAGRFDPAIAQPVENISGTVAGRSREGWGVSGAGGSPPIGGLPLPPQTETGADYGWLNPNDGLPPIDGDDHES